MSARWFVCLAAVVMCAAVPSPGVLDLSNGGYTKDVLKREELLKHGDPSHWEEVNLSGNHIDEIDDNTFLGFENLKKLSLASNSLGTIEDHWFRGTNLRSLDLSKNVLVAIRSDAFADLTQLRELSLANNLLRPFKTNTFEHTPRLEKLSLDNNPRVQDMFLNVTIPSLEELSLKTCRILNISTLHLENVPNLKTVVLANNILQNLDEGAFVSNSKLKEVDVRGNFLDNLRGATLKKAFSPNSKVFIHFDLGEDICTDCKIHPCSDDLELQQFLCQSTNSSTFRDVYVWTDQEENVAVTLKAYAQKSK